MSFPIRQLIDSVAGDAARDAITPINNYRSQQTQAAAQPVIGIVQQIVNNSPTQISGPAIVVMFSDGTTSTCQVGNRWLSVGDVTVVFGGMAH